MKILEIEKIVEENSVTKSFYFTDSMVSKAEAGQFVMLWVPHVISGEVDFDVPDQVPMSVSSVEGDTFTLTVRKYGKTTAELFKYTEGDRVGVTGPLGRGFTISGNRILCVAGGIGIAPLFPLVKSLQNNPVYFILGAKTKDELLFQRELEDSCTLYITTDDGSCGTKEFASDPVEKLCNEYDIDQIYCCGPEKMMYKVFETSQDLKVPAQFSLERYMYCGLGICGHCAVNGYLVCRDGPVFTSEELENVQDFGVKEIDKTGRKIDI